MTEKDLFIYFPQLVGTFLGTEFSVENYFLLEFEGFFFPIAFKYAGFLISFAHLSVTCICKTF